MSKTKISVIICTHNRCELIPKTIESLLGQTLDDTLYEMVIVDNGSTDNTKQVCDQYKKYSNFRYLYEDKLGLSYARNAGIDSAKGEIVAFIDDDAEADSDWLSNIVAAFDKDKVDCVGGRAIGVFKEGRPEWLHENLLSFLGIIDYGNEKKILTYPRYPAGVNISFRKGVFNDVGKFETKLGRKGYSLLSCEEMALCSRIEAKGGKILYAPNVSVYHHILSKRLEQSWFKNRAYWQGISEAVLEKEYLGLGHILIKLSKILVILPVYTAIFLWSTFLRKKDVKLLSVCRVYICTAYIRGLLFDTGVKSLFLT